jgi:putative colanic acid biosynthesis acetyltransferase WcaF
MRRTSSLSFRTKSDPYLLPAFSVRNRAMRFVWGVVYAVFFWPSPRPMHSWRNFLLSCFGAKIAPHCHIAPSARIWAPWNLACEENATIGAGAVIYNPKLLYMASHSIVSQQAYICGATHDYEDATFPLISSPMTLGAYSWVCARAVVQPGVNLGEGAVLGLASVATRDLEPWTVYGGIPARKIKQRVLRNHHES